jgi:protein TonB
MFDRLLETRSRREKRSAAGTVASVMIHSAVIVGAMAATAVGSTPPPTVREGGFTYVAPPTPPGQPPAPLTRPTAWLAPAPPDVIVDMIEMPPITWPLTGVNPTPGPATDPATSFDPGARHGGVPGAGDPVASPTGGDPWTAALVEKPAIALPGSSVPAYPDMLRRAGVEGEVVAQFVVDTTGRVEPTSFRAVRVTQPLFASAVEQVLPRLRFIPAEAGGHRVRQLVQQSFVFAIER